MSLTLLFICRRSINVSNFIHARAALLRPLYCSRTIFLSESSTLKSKYGSLKPSSSHPNPFHEPTDEKSRRLKLQKHIRFREKFQLENDYELIYAMPRQQMYSLMHLLCTSASITMFVFVLMQFHHEMLDMEPVLPNLNPEIPLWTLYSMATIVGSSFGILLILISRMPVRLYYSPVRHSYALFYHPIIGVFRQKKILFRDNQYKLIRQKLDSIDAPQRSIKIRIELGQGFFRTKKSFYLIENLFRSKRDVQRIRGDESKNDQTTKESNQAQEVVDIWETVMEKKDSHQPPPPPSRRTFM